MRFQPTRLADYTDASLLAEVQRVAALVGEASLSTTRFSRHSRVALTTIRRRFGSWREALQAAGLGHMYIEIPPARISRTLGRELTNDQILNELNRVAAMFDGGTLTVEQFKRVATIGPDSVRGRFGSWPQALQAAGIESANHGRRYSDQACFENLLRVWQHFGRPPKYQEMNAPPSVVGGKAYMSRWGTWNRAIHEFARFVESDVEGPGSRDPEPVGELEPRPSPPRQKPEDRREPSIGVRYRVLSRDRFRCVLCGRNPSTDPGCELHVDHVLPVSKGGKTIIENLRALCEKCNLGKGNSLEGEHQ